MVATVVAPLRDTAPVPVEKVVAPVWDMFPDVVNAPPSATTKTSSTSIPPFALRLPVKVVIPVTASVESKVTAVVTFPPVIARSPNIVKFPASVRDRISVPPSVCSIRSALEVEDLFETR